MKKKYLLFLLFFSGILFNVKLSAQCHVQASICQSGTAGPFIFSTPGSSVGTCLDWIGDSAAYITLYITQGGPHNLLIDGDVNTGVLDVAIFNIPPGVAPCTSILSTSNQLGCNYADYANGCVQFGTAFPCNSSVPAPNVAAGDVIMIVVENWSDGNTSGGAPSNNFTLSLHPNGAQSGMPDLTIIDPGEFCLDDNSTQLMVSHMGGEWSGPGVSSSGMFNPSLAGVGTHTIHYSLGAVPCLATSSIDITVNPLPSVSVGSDVVICYGESTTLTATGSGFGDVEYLWNTGDTTSEIIVSPLITTTYEVLVTDANGCQNTAEVTVTVHPLITPEFSPVPEMCYGDEIPPLPTISLNGISGSWSPSLNNTVTTEYTFTPDESQSCALQTTLTIIIHEINSENLTALKYCDPNSDGFGIFDLTQVIPIIEGVNTVDVDITFHETEDDALFNANNIEDLNPLTAYPNIDDYNQTIYVRISNDSGCFAVIPLELIVYDLPKITKTISPLEVCDDDYDGSAEFNLTDALSDIMNGLDLSLHTISYHPTQNDASLDENAIGNFANYDSASGSVWVRVEDDQTGCFDVVELALVVNPLPVVS